MSRTKQHFVGHRMCGYKGGESLFQEFSMEMYSVLNTEITLVLDAAWVPQHRVKTTI